MDKKLFDKIYEIADRLSLSIHNKHLFKVPTKDQLIISVDLAKSLLQLLEEIEDSVSSNAKLTPTEQKAFNKVIEAIHKIDKPFKEAVAQLQQEKPDLATAIRESSIGLSMKYWLMQFLAPLNRKELKAVVDGFMLNHITDETAHNLIKFLIKRFPSYYYDELGNPKVNF